LAGGDARIRARIDHLRMYQHYLLLRWQLEQAAATGDADAIIAAIGAETSFGARLTYTNMLHTRPLIGKAFERRFRAHSELLKDHPDAQPNGLWRKIGTPPEREELDAMWAADHKLLEQSSIERRN
jgi:hypothetical protein